MTIVPVLINITCVRFVRVMCGLGIRHVPRDGCEFPPSMHMLTTCCLIWKRRTVFLCSGGRFFFLFIFVFSRFHPENTRSIRDNPRCPKPRSFNFIYFCSWPNNNSGPTYRCAYIFRWVFRALHTETNISIRV